MSKDVRFRELRKASEQERFPYKGIGARSYYEVDQSGHMHPLGTVAELRATIPKAQTGQYRSDIFYVDDVDALAAAGI